MTLVDDGSRFVPWSSDPILGLEHIHRYRWVQKMVANKRVLDIACGEGYGSALLAQTARHVIGVDLDLVALKHARARYQLANITFIQANAEQFALAPHSLDVAVCFETLEHLSAHDALLSVLQPALTDDGILFISTPNKQVYTDEADFHNPHHARELYYAEFDALLKRYFNHVEIFGQAVVVGSVLSQNQDGVFLHNTQQLEVAVFEQTSDQRIVTTDTKLAPRYFVACCSRQPIPRHISALLLSSQPFANTVLTDLTSALHKSDEYARQVESTLTALKTAEVNARDYITQQLQMLNEAIAYARHVELQHAELNKTYEAAVAYARSMETKIIDLESSYAQLNTTYTEAVTYVRSLEDHINQVNNEQIEVKKIYDEAVAYARSLEIKLHDLEENLRQFTDIRK
jgi:O-antigen biosynthesis protein